MDLFEIVRERPIAENPEGRPTCPWHGCRYPFGCSGEGDKGILGTEWRTRHRIQYCLCSCCHRKFERHTVGTNVWYTATQDRRSVVQHGMPSCFEDFVYHCAKCDGPVSRKHHQLDKDEPFPEPKPDENGIAINVLVAKISGGKVERQYRIKFACEACGHGGYTEDEHWRPPVQPAAPMKKVHFVNANAVEKVITTRETWAGPAGTEVLMVMPCESAVPNRKAVLCRLPSGMQGAMWEDEIRRPDPEIKVLHDDGLDLLVERVEAAPVEFIQLDMTIAAAEPQKEVPMGEKLWVHYVVGGVPHKAGPYSPEEVEAHRADIAGFEGVTDVVVRHAESTKPYNGEDMVGEPDE